MRKVAQNRKRFESMLREVRGQFECWPIRLRSTLVEQARIVKVVCGVIAQSISVFDGSVDLLSGYLVNSLRIGLGKGYCHYLVEGLVSFKYVPGVGRIIVYWRADIGDVVESGPSTSKGHNGGKTHRYRGPRRNRGLC